MTNTLSRPASKRCFEKNEYRKPTGVSGAKPLRGALAGYYRLRTGDYRLQFHVAGETVLVEKIGHRDGFYED
jgi:mRNA-degrading endonuclease RelE of RelBE toxin-antitoxin system